MTRPGDHQVSVDEFERWIEPLDEALACVLTGARVIQFPWHSSTMIDGTKVRTSRTSNIEKPDVVAEPEAIVAAMSEAAVDLSREIAAALTGTP